MIRIAIQLDKFSTFVFTLSSKLFITTQDLVHHVLVVVKLGPRLLYMPRLEPQSIFLRDKDID